MYRRFTVIALMAMLVAGLPATLGARETAAPGQLIRATSVLAGTPGGPLSAAQARRLNDGPLAADADELARQKALAAAEAGQDVQPLLDEPQATTPNPTTPLNKEGLAATTGAPSDSTGAIGTTRYIENVNSRAAIYRTTDLGVISTATLNDFYNTGDPLINSFDPQILWDATTQRFYYTGDVIVDDTHNYLAYGWSKTASPSNLTTDWCHVFFAFGAEFPDYPKLGDSQPYALIGVNTFSFSGAFRGSDLLAINKPAAGTVCPSPDQVTGFIKKDLRIGTTTVAFTPVPTTGVDSSATGWAVSRTASVPSTQLGLFKVTKNASNVAVFAAGTSVTVPQYLIPAPAPQKGTTAVRLDTSDTRPTQAIQAIDPLKGSKFAIWTQHTVKGGAGSMVRWYEIDPVTRTILQSNVVSSTTLWYFNGAISPDRKVKTGSPSVYGGNMLINVSSSSATTYPAIRMQAKRGANAPSLVVLVKASTGPNIDFACNNQNKVCRWGDYAAATPDPNAPTGKPAGVVWNTNMWNVAGSSLTGNPVWRTQNWKALP